MTFSNAQSLRTCRRPAIIRACGLGLALALTAPLLAFAGTAATPGGPHDRARYARSD